MDEAICALASPYGSGGIAVIRISGRDIFSRVNPFISSKNIEKAKKNSALFSSFISAEKKQIDDVVVTIFHGPTSFTGEDVLEISCHCNRIIIEKILGELHSVGIRMAEPGEFSKRAFLNSKLDLTQAEAISALIEANNEYAVNNALNILDGRLSEIVHDMKKKLIQTAGLLEIDLDFSEEDLNLVDLITVEKYINQCIDMILSFIKKSDELRFVNDGIRLAIVGQPNAGKSSLLNVLLGKNRALVSDIEGTTRDTIEEMMSINGIPVRLIDTAGIRDSNDEIEKMGVELSFNTIDKADCVILLIDATKGKSKEDKAIIDKINAANKKVIIAYNKSDLVSDKMTKDGLAISAKTEYQIDELKNLISNLFQTAELEASESIVVSNLRHKQALLSTVNFLEKAKEAISNKYGHELISIDIREAIEELSKITGEITNNDILNDIFDNFCIGK